MVGTHPPALSGFGEWRRLQKGLERTSRESNGASFGWRMRIAGAVVSVEIPRACQGGVGGRGHRRYSRGLTLVNGGCRLFPSDVDMESEAYRWMGSLRFTVGTIVRIIGLRHYRGRISFVPAGTGDARDATDSPGAHKVRNARGESACMKSGPSWVWG